MGGVVHTIPQSSVGTAEDKRAAASLQASISSFVFTAALAIIAAEGALITFYFEHRIILWFGTFALFATPILVVLSFIAGGKGISKLSVRGYAGDWDPKSVSGTFNAQAWFTLLAAIGIVVSVWGTAAKSEPKDIEQRLTRMNDRLYVVDQALHRLGKKTPVATKAHATH